jgi:hypothetical protein
MAVARPLTGTATFLSDDDPPVIDEIEQFGQIRWHEPGYNECPEDPASAVEPNLPLSGEIRWGSIRSAYRD